MTWWTKTAYLGGTLADVRTLRDIILEAGGEFRVTMVPIMGSVMLIENIPVEMAESLELIEWM